MIKAKSNYYARIIFDIYINKLLKKNFSHFYLINNFPELKSNDSVVLVPNHFSWWDGFFIDWVLKKETNYSIKLMMLERQLKRYWFFNYIGAFSIDPEKPTSTKETMSYSRSLIRAKENALIIYSQGIIEPYEKRPIKLKKGLRVILKTLENIKVIPVGFKISYSEEKSPSILCRFGEPLLAKTIVNDFNFFEESFNNNLELLDSSNENMNYVKDYFQK